MFGGGQWRSAEVGGGRWRSIEVGGGRRMSRCLDFDVQIRVYCGVVVKVLVVVLQASGFRVWGFIPSAFQSVSVYPFPVSK